MAFQPVITVFDEPAALERGRSVLSGAVIALLPVEPDSQAGDGQAAPAGHARWWARLQHLRGEGALDPGPYAEAVRRGSLLLVAAVPEEQVRIARSVLRSNGAVDLERRVERWKQSGWTGYEPLAPPLTGRELLEERRLDEEERLGFTVRLFNKATGEEIGSISEEELAVLADALEKESHDDTDYWIHPDIIDSLETRLGAYRRLSSMLRAAMGPEGMEIVYQRPAGPLQ